MGRRWIMAGKGKTKKIEGAIHGIQIQVIGVVMLMFGLLLKDAYMTFLGAFVFVSGVGLVFRSV